MDLSSFFAKFLGIYLLIMVAIWLFRKETFEKAANDILSSDGTLAMTGAIQILIGLIIVILHPAWTADWRSVITLIGYASIVQGILRLAFPIQFRDIILKSLEKGYWFWLVFSAALGIFLTYYGFTH